MSPEFLRFLFLALLALTIVLAIIRIGGSILGLLGNLFRSFLDLAMGLAGFGVIIIFFIFLFRIDPMPYIRQGAYLLSFQQLVSFEEAIPPNLKQNLQVVKIDKVDTDSDGFKEWVVYYRFDRRGENGPIQAMVYDNDRGDPPVIFPYSLRPPGRDYLAEGPASDVSLEMKSVDINQNEAEASPLEVTVKSKTDLSIFRFRQNSAEWDFPRDAPPRYESIGFFRGNGGVTLGGNNDVTVQDRSGYERSQLVVRSIYGLNPATNTYWDRFYEPPELERQLAAPTFSTVDFFGGTPPDNIYQATYPEIIALSFYASTCATGNSTLCSDATAGWDPGLFLAGDARREFENGNPDYFGIPAFDGTQQLAVTNLRYFPGLETDPDLLPTGGGRDVVTGEEGQLDVVSVSFVVNDLPLNTVFLGTSLVNGEWKILRRLSPDDLPQLVSPAQITTTSEN